MKTDNSIIGREYLPTYNCFNVNLSTPHEPKDIGGNMFTPPQITTVLTPPFEAKILMVTGEYKVFKMVIVGDEQGQAHSVLYDSERLLTAENRDERINFEKELADKFKKFIDHDGTKTLLERREHPEAFSCLFPKVPQPI
jgi:DNA polymerase II large subunit